MSKGWIGVDLDGTLAEYHGWKGETHIGPPILVMLARVKRWLEDGHEVRIFTARVGNVERDEDFAVRTAIGSWCMTHLGRELPITAVKDYAMIELWDDRVVQVIPNTGLRVDETVAQVKTWPAFASRPTKKARDRSQRSRA